MPTVNQLYCVLLLHLFLLIDSVDRANGQATRALRSHQIQKEKRHQQYESHFLAKKFRVLTGNTQVLHFDDNSVVKEALHDVTSHFLRQSTDNMERSDEIALVEDDKGDEAYPRRRLSMVLAVVKTSPSAVTRQGVALSASIQHLQVAFKTAGDCLRRAGQKVKKGTVTTVKSTGRFLQSALIFFFRQYRRLIAFVVFGIANMVQSIAGGIKTVEDKMGMVKAAPATAAVKTPTASPSTTVSTPPVMSRISTPSTTPAQLTSKSSAHFPDWLTTSSTTKTTASAKKSQALSNVSIQKLMNSFKKDDDNSLEVVPEQSYLAGMFSSLMEGFLILSTGVFVGYHWSEWHEEDRQESLYHMSTGAIVGHLWFNWGNNQQEAMMGDDGFVEATEVTSSTKKSQAVSNGSVQKLKNAFKKEEDNSLEVVPEQSYLAGMFSSLMGGLLALSTGALVGYVWSDWQEDRQEAMMRDDDFIEATEVVGVRQLRSRSVPVTPEISRS